MLKRNTGVPLAAVLAGLLASDCGSPGTDPDPGRAREISTPTSGPRLAEPCAEESVPRAPSEPLVPSFLPGPDDILRDLVAWDRATPDERRARARALEPRLEGFTLRGLETFSCGAQIHEVAVYVDEPTGMEFVLVPAGTVVPESPEDAEGPARPIVVAAPFLIARTEVTQCVWHREMGGDLPSGGDPAVAAGGISFDEAVAFCGQTGFDLPSSDEREFACRAGAITRFSFGDDASRLEEFAWTSSNAGGVLHAVGQRPPNAFGLFDVHGNAREWCRGATGDGADRVACGEGSDGRDSHRRSVRRGTSVRWSIGLRPVFTIPRSVPERAEDEVLRVTANGVQVYVLVADADGTLAWKFVGPRADLFDDDGRRIGSHRLGVSGPVWEIGGQRIEGRKLSERPSPDAGSIPELELCVLSISGEGALAGVTRVDRVHTCGGAPPSTAGHRVGDEVQVPYSAQYVFRAQPR